jgi:hypothetical protein
MSFDLGSFFDPARSMAQGTFNGASFVDPLGGDPYGISGGSNADAPLASITGAGATLKPAGSQTTNQADQWLAQTARGQYDYYKQNYVPFENDLIAGATGSTAPRVNSALAALGQQQSNLAGIQQRNMARYGMTQDPNLRSDMSRQMQLSNAAQMANASNSLSQSLYDQNQSTLGGLAALGRNLSTQSMEGMDSAARTAASRAAQKAAADQAQAQAAAAQQSQAMSTAASLGMLAYLAL